MRRTWIGMCVIGPCLIGMCVIGMGLGTGCGGSESTQDASGSRDAGTDATISDTAMPDADSGRSDATSMDASLGDASGDAALDTGAMSMTDATASDASGPGTRSVVYLKGETTDASDAFGWSIALSASGSTLVVGTPLDDGPMNASADSGAVYVFRRSGTSWAQQAYLRASNADAGDRFGSSVSISDGGDVLLVGAPFEDGAGRAIGALPTTNTFTDSGAAYLFRWSGSAWMQEAYVKSSNSDPGDFFGHAVAISRDGASCVIGAYGEDGSSRVINDNPTSNAANTAGAAYVFSRGETWTQAAYLKALNADPFDAFGHAVAISGDGTIVVIGAINEDGGANGVSTDAMNETATNSGAAYAFAKTGGAWAANGYLKASNTGANDSFGQSLSLSADGATLAVGAHREDSSARGIDVDGSLNDADNSGAVYLYRRQSGAWSHQTYIKASNADPNDLFGWSVALSPDGSTLAVGAQQESGNGRGVSGNAMNNDAFQAGAVYLFSRTGATWSSRLYVKASNTERLDLFGQSVGLGSEGTLAASARDESSASTGIGGDTIDNSAPGAGATYLY